MTSLHIILDKHFQNDLFTFTIMFLKKWDNFIVHLSTSSVDVLFVKKNKKNNVCLRKRFDFNISNKLEVLLPGRILLQSSPVAFFLQNIMMSP